MIEVNMRVKMAGTMTGLASCQTCGVVAHSHVPLPREGINRHIHRLEGFRGKTCWQIAHEQFAISDAGGQGIWAWRAPKNNKGVSYSVQTSHPIVMQLRKLHGIGEEGAKRGSKRARSSSQNGK